MMPIERRQVRVKPHSYQPTKNELEKPFVIHKEDGTLPTPEELARTTLAPVKIIEDPEA